MRTSTCRCHTGGMRARLRLRSGAIPHARWPRVPAPCACMHAWAASHTAPTRATHTRTARHKPPAARPKLAPAAAAARQRRQRRRVSTNPHPWLRLASTPTHRATRGPCTRRQRKLSHNQSLFRPLSKWLPALVAQRAARRRQVRRPPARATGGPRNASRRKRRDATRRRHSNRYRWLTGGSRFAARSHPQTRPASRGTRRKNFLQ